VSAVLSSPVTGEPDGARGHRLTGSQAEAIASRIPHLAEFHILTQILAVRGVDKGSPWVESFLTKAERAAVLLSIEEVAPRPANPEP
jgi:hypothetical protein